MLRGVDVAGIAGEVFCKAMCSEDLVTGGPITGAEFPTGRIDDAELPVAIAAAATALLVHGAATGPFQES
jgi:hypothetical protein